jgi:hypothetical protein
MENNLSRTYLENLSSYQESQVISTFLMIMVMRSHPSISFKSAILEDGYFYAGLQLLSGQYIMRIYYLLFSKDMRLPLLKFLFLIKLIYFLNFWNCLILLFFKKYYYDIVFFDLEFGEKVNAT